MAGGTLVAVYLIVRRGPAGPCAACARRFRAFAFSGFLWGSRMSSCSRRSPAVGCSIVSPLVAVESLVGVVLAALLLSRTELVGRHLWIGAALIVTGGALIGAFR